MRGAVETFEPVMTDEVREARLAAWREALGGVLS
jgi:hypothetical protein